MRSSQSSGLSPSSPRSSRVGLRQRLDRRTIVQEAWRPEHQDERLLGVEGRKLIDRPPAPGIEVNDPTCMESS
jgi:hypothetical protein